MDINRSLQRRMARDRRFRREAWRVFLGTCRYRYSYNFTWLGRPIIQYPPDVLAVQELIWRVKPDLVVETGVAHGGSLMLSASLLALLGGRGRVVGIDVEIRKANRAAIERHPLARRITLIEGSSTDEAVARRVRALAKGRRVMVFLDSMHTHDHVRRELELYAPLVTAGSYLVVFDTIIEFLPKSFFPDRPWGPGDNPWTAVREFLKGNRRFTVDEAVERKLLFTVAPGGYLRCVK
jgi:cephalosporin hydroxylase